MLNPCRLICKALKTVLVGQLFVILLSSGMMAQNSNRANIYRYILDIDVPESPALVAFGFAPTPTLRGSAPKPISATLLMGFQGSGAATTGFTIDSSPYYIAGGGIRKIESYRSNSLAGRLLRVLTKTLLSLGASKGYNTTSDFLVAFGIRSTFHDPHDPLLNSHLFEEVAALLARHGVAKPDITVENLRDLGVNLETVYANARREIRGRNGDFQVSGGGGIAGRVKSGIWDSDSLISFHQSLWLSGQFTEGHRFDIISTAQVRRAFRSSDFWLGIGILRKSPAVDFKIDVAYDFNNKKLHPGLAIDSRLFQHGRIEAAVTTSSALSNAITGEAPSKLVFRAMLRVFHSSEN